MEEGVLPDSCKTAAVVPIHKGGDKSIPANYRPVSLTSVIVKILERIIRKAIVTHLESNNLMNDTQHGFRKGRSCISALINVYDDIMHSLMASDNHCVDMIYLDFAKAFDKVDHNILLHKLKSLGITGNIGIWISSFLGNRKQFVQIPGGISEIGSVTSGVPQGTVLGPVLFLILIGDITKNLSHSKVSSFADDTRLYSSIKNEDDCDNLQKDLDIVYKWAIENNMQFNSQKFEYLCFHTKPALYTNNVYLTPKINIINPSFDVRDLGIIMTNTCTFNQHISKVVKTCTQLVGMTLRAISARDKLSMLTVYKSTILPRLEYGCQLWNPNAIHLINSLERVQRSFTKYIDNMYDISYEKRLSALNLYSLQRRRDRYLICHTNTND